MNKKLNLGSGYKRFDGFLNIDSDNHCEPDYIVNLENERLPFEDNSVDEIKAHHILEHIGEGFFHLMKETYRVCENGAFVDIRVPHHWHECFINDPTHRRPITVEGMRLFSKKYNQREIDTEGSSSTLGFIFDVDFEIVSFDYIPDPFYREIVQSNTQEQNIRLFRECVNVVQETHIILVVVK